MEQLKNIAKDGKLLAEGLRKNGRSHQNYKHYTTTERALAILLSGDFFLANGDYWNDTKDRELLKRRKAYASCFSVSTRENIAMWMLYGEGGKKGIMINFLPSVMQEICNVEEVTLGRFENSQFQEKKTLKKADNDFEIYLTDVVYEDPCEKNKQKSILTIGEEHYTTDKSILENENVFHKNYAWSYEKECRLVVKLPEDIYEDAKENKYSHIRIRIPEKALRKIRGKNHVVQSPVYSGVAIGENSVLRGKVDWRI